MRDGRRRVQVGGFSFSGGGVDVAGVAGLFQRCGLVFRRSRNAADGVAWVVDDGGGADFVSIHAEVDAVGGGDAIEMRAMA